MGGPSAYNAQRKAAHIIWTAYLSQWWVGELGRVPLADSVHKRSSKLDNANGVKREMK